MKVLMINGSPDPKGCIHAAMMIAKEVFESRGVECEEIIVGNKDIRDRKSTRLNSSHTS